MSELLEYIENFKQKKVLIIGDSILDNFIYGNTTRISPDAPVPLVDVQSEESFIGSLGRVARYLSILGAKVDILSCIGDDFEGKFLLEEIEKLGIAINGIKILNTFTPKITRIISRDQQLVRIEKRYNLNNKIMREVNDFFEQYLMKNIDSFDSVIILDYDLGLLNQILITQILATCKKHNKKVLVRPEQQKYYLYKEIDTLIMNRNIASTATGIQPLNETCMRIMGLKILNEIQASLVFVPWIEGDSYYYKDNECFSISSHLNYKARSFFGVGSAIVATLGALLSVSTTVENKLTIAHFAGSLAGLQHKKEYFELNKLKEAIKNDQIPSK